MDGSLSWIIEIIEKETRRRIANAIKRNQEKYEKHIKLERGMMIRRWFGDFDGSRWAVEALQHVNTVAHVSGINASITFTSFTSTEVGNFDRAEAWKARRKENGEPLPMDEPSEEYVSKLVWEEGIIGLPANSTLTDWVNPVFHKNKPLDMHMQETTEWDQVEETLRQMISNDIN